MSTFDVYIPDSISNNDLVAPLARALRTPVDTVVMLDSFDDLDTLPEFQPGERRVVVAAYAADGAPLKHVDVISGQEWFGAPADDAELAARLSRELRMPTYAYRQDESDLFDRFVDGKKQPDGELFIDGDGNIEAPEGFVWF